MKLVAIVSLLILSFKMASANPESIYTKIDNSSCIAINANYLLPEEEQEIDFYEGVCPSFGGYVLGVSGGDIRYSVTLSYDSKEIELPRLSQFHDTGAVVEWRYERVGADAFNMKLKYSALIYRLNYNEYDDQGMPTDRSMLVVVRLNEEKSCVIGMLKNQKDMNQKARDIADNLSASCINLNN